HSGKSTILIPLSKLYNKIKQTPSVVKLTSGVCVLLNRRLDCGIMGAYEFLGCNFFAEQRLNLVQMDFSGARCHLHISEQGKARSPIHFIQQVDIELRKLYLGCIYLGSWDDTGSRHRFFSPTLNEVLHELLGFRLHPRILCDEQSDARTAHP